MTKPIQSDWLYALLCLFELGSK